MLQALHEVLTRGRRRKLMFLADAVRDGGDFAKARELYRDVAREFPAHFGAWVQLGNMAKDSAVYSDAAAAYAVALRLRPDDADVHVQLGHLAKLEGDREAARRWYQLATQLDPERSDAIIEVSRLDGGPAFQAASRDFNGSIHSTNRAALVRRRLETAFQFRSR